MFKAVAASLPVRQLPRCGKDGVYVQQRGGMTAPKRHEQSHGLVLVLVLVLVLGEKSECVPLLTSNLLLYIQYVEIIRDEPKRETNLTKYGLDFADLSLEFFRDVRIGPTKADRFVAVGELNGQMIIAVIFKPLGSEAISIISMRPASSKEGRA